MKQKLKSLRKKKKTVEHRNRSDTHSLALPLDPVQFCREWLYYEPFIYMHPYLRDQNHFTATLQARQTGKTFNGMAKLLYLAFLYPGSTFLVTAPKFGQVKRVAFKHLHDHMRRMKRNNPNLFYRVCNEKGLLKSIIRLKNGSTILAESPVPETIRGHTVKAVYLMEMNFIREDEELFTAVLFTLNTTNGYLITESTPWNTDSVFYKIYHDKQYNHFNTHTIPYTEALHPNGPLTPKIVDLIKTQLQPDPSRWKREMLCQWTEDTDRWLPTSLISHCQDPIIEYFDPFIKKRGIFFVGLDLGKKQDHSVITVIESKHNQLFLRLCHQFALDTPYSTVIGYLKQIQDTWPHIYALAMDKTGVGEYIYEDMHNHGIRNIKGVTFTLKSKETMASALREAMRKGDCPQCHWTGHINPAQETPKHCPNKCLRGQSPQLLTPNFHIPYDQDLFNELNIPTYVLTKTGNLRFTHPASTHDDRFWSLALAVYASLQDKLKPPIVS